MQAQDVTNFALVCQAELRDNQTGKHLERTVIHVRILAGKLTPEERREIEKHCEYGARVLQIAEKKLQFQSFLNIAIQLTLYHHEKWDGIGYPHEESRAMIKGLRGIHLDPLLVDAFLRKEGDFRRISEELAV